MRLAVVGAGAVGTFLAHVLASGGADVVLVRRAHRGSAARTRMTRIEPGGSRMTAEVTVANAIDAGEAAPDAILLTVKAFDLDAAIGGLGEWPAVPTVTVQNGVGAEEVAAALRPHAPLTAASLTASVALRGPQEVVRFRGGGIGLAPWSGDSSAVTDELAGMFRAGGLPCRRFPEARAMKWSKLLGNLVANATGALADLDAAAVYSHPGLFAIERDQLRETLDVLSAMRLKVVALPGADTRALALIARLPTPVARQILKRVVGGARGGKSPSLREHVRAGIAGPSEVEWLNGAVTRGGLACGVPTPVNAALTALVNEVTADAGRRAALAGRPDRVVEAVRSRSAPFVGELPDAPSEGR